MSETGESPKSSTPLLGTIVEPEMDENPPVISYPDHKYSFTQILIHLFKSNIGVGILNLPKNMSRAGIILGPIFSLFCILPIIHCMLLLLKCSQEIKKRTGKKTIGYAGTFRYAFVEHISGYSRYLAYVLNLYLVSTQLGVCIVYVTFTAQTLYEITEKSFSDLRIYMLIVGAIILPLVLVTRLDIMSILSGSANAMCSFSLVCTLAYILMDIKDLGKISTLGDLNQFPLFLSSILYVYEGINVVIPLENEIDNPERYPLALKIATYVCGVMYFVFAILGYIAYGNNAKDSVTFNLPQQSFTNIIKIVYAIGIMLTFFIQFHIGMNAMMPTILKRVESSMRRTLYSSIIRVLFAMFIVLFAVVIPQMSNLISLIGAFSCATLSLVFPCMIHLATYWNSTDENRLTTFEIIKDFTLILFGVFMTVTGVTTTVSTIISDYNKSDK